MDLRERAPRENFLDRVLIGKRLGIVRKETVSCLASCVQGNQNLWTFLVNKQDCIKEISDCINQYFLLIETIQKAPNIG